MYFLLKILFHLCQFESMDHLNKGDLQLAIQEEDIYTKFKVDNCQFQIPLIEMQLKWINVENLYCTNLNLLETKHFQEKKQLNLLMKNPFLK
jgi:hypothetical protein